MRALMYKISHLMHKHPDLILKLLKTTNYTLTFINKLF